VTLIAPPRPVVSPEIRAERHGPRCCDRWAHQPHRSLLLARDGSACRAYRFGCTVAVRRSSRHPPRGRSRSAAWPPRAGPRWSLAAGRTSWRRSSGHKHRRLELLHLLCRGVGARAGRRAAGSHLESWPEICDRAARVARRLPRKRAAARRRNDLCQRQSWPGDRGWRGSQCLDPRQQRTVAAARADSWHRTARHHDGRDGRLGVGLCEESPRVPSHRRAGHVVTRAAAGLTPAAAASGSLLVLPGGRLLVSGGSPGLSATSDDNGATWRVSNALAAQEESLVAPMPGGGICALSSSPTKTLQERAYTSSDGSAWTPVGGVGTRPLLAVDRLASDSGAIIASERAGRTRQRQGLVQPGLPDLAQHRPGRRRCRTRSHQ